MARVNFRPLCLCLLIATVFMRKGGKALLRSHYKIVVFLLLLVLLITVTSGRAFAYVITLTDPVANVFVPGDVPVEPTEPPTEPTTPPTKPPTAPTEDTTQPEETVKPTVPADPDNAPTGDLNITLLGAMAAVSFGMLLILSIEKSRKNRS